MEIISPWVIWLLLAMTLNTNGDVYKCRDDSVPPPAPQEDGNPQPFPPPDSGGGASPPSEKGYELVLVQILHRHGDRSPLVTYPNDPNPPTVWPEGFGQLSLHGRLQLWVVGKHLHTMYNNFLEFSPNEVYVNSSGTDRCLKSVLSLTASFYAPRPKWQFAPNIYWDPTTVHYVAQKDDIFLKYGEYCRAAKLARFKSITSPEMNNLIEKYKGTLDHFSNYSGFITTQLDGPDNMNALNLYDTLNVEIRWGLIIPHWVTPQNFAELDKFNTEATNLIYLGSHDSVKYGIGPLVGKIYDNMAQRRFGKTNVTTDLDEKYGIHDQFKVFIYSAHDTNIQLMLKALDIYDGILPNYAATLIFELYQKDGQFFVRILYINPKEAAEYVGPTQVLTLKDCSEFCPIEKLKALIEEKDIVPKDYEAKCA